MSETFKKMGIPTLVIATALMLMAPAMLSTGAFAVGPTSTTKSQGLHFVGQPNLTVNKDDDSASLTATGEVAGAGTGGSATLATTAEVTVGCITPPGNNEPSGLQTSTETTTGSETFTTTNGRGTFTVTTDEVTIPSDFNCPSANMEETLVSVLFTDITLTITTNEGKVITATFADIDP